eukprot:9336946-Karenia_brevis.AAC.1
MSDLSKLPLRTSAEGFFQPMGDITNSCRSFPVSADPSVAGSRASSTHFHRGLGPIQGEQWGDKRKRQDEVVPTRETREGF